MSNDNNDAVDRAWEDWHRLIALDARQDAMDRAWQEWHHHVNRRAVQPEHRPHSTLATYALSRQNAHHHFPTSLHGVGSRHRHGDNNLHIYYGGSPMHGRGAASGYYHAKGAGVRANHYGHVAQYHGGVAAGRSPGRCRLDDSTKIPGNSMFGRKRCDDLDVVQGGGDVADFCGPASKRMHGTQVLPDYVPDPTNDAIPDNIAGEYYMVYKRLHPTSGDAKTHQHYVELILQTLSDPSEIDTAIEVLEVLQSCDDVDERNLIYSIAKLIGSLPVLFVGLSALLHTYCIERRSPMNSPGTHPTPLSIGETDDIPNPRALGVMTDRPSSLERNDDGLAMSTAASRDTEGSPYVCALSLLSDTATKQTRASGKQPQQSFWAKFDEGGTGSAVQWAKAENAVQLAKTDNANGQRRKRPANVTQLQMAKPHAVSTPVATSFLAAGAPAATTSTLPAVKQIVAPVAIPVQTPSKKSMTPASPVSRDVTDAILQAHAAAWKKRPAYDRWLSERDDNATDPDRSRSLFNELEKQRCELLKQIQHAHLEGSAKR